MTDEPSDEELYMAAGLDISIENLPLQATSVAYELAGEPTVTRSRGYTFFWAIQGSVRLNDIMKKQKEWESSR